MKIQALAVGQLAANCYLVIDEATNAAVIIDPGDAPEEIEAAVCAAGADVKHILFTHGHPDHVFSAGEVQKVFDVYALMHEADVPQFGEYKDLVATLFDPARYIPPRLGEFLKDGDVLHIGETEFKVIHTPGHSPGGLCFASGSIIFTGDTLFAGTTGRTDLLGGSLDDLTLSIHQKLLILPDDTVIYPGHGPSSTIGAEKAGNIWL
ncbi:MAG: MBL fold metallo-hydrolase [Armatimonadota bacterium]